MKISSGGWKLLGFVAVFGIGVTFAYSILKPTPSLPIYDPADLNPKLVDKSLQNRVSKHRIADFSLINQLGDTVTQKDLAGKIYVADFFFTTCQSICPKMTNQLSRVAAAYSDNPKIMLVSHTVDPETDSVAVMKAYADANGINPKQWLMLTGDKKEIYKLARKSYFVVIDEPSLEGPDFIHTENFVLVDSKKRLRGFYDGTSKEEVDKLIGDIESLLNEEKN